MIVEADRTLVSVPEFRAIVDDWLAELESPQRGYEILAAATGEKADTWRVRLSDLTSTSPHTGLVSPRGWYARDAIDIGDVDRFLVAAGLEHLWHSRLAGERIGLHCEDCGRRITDETGYRPLDLFRPDPASQQDVIWDATKQKLVTRPGAARAGGRRFRNVDLCRRCAGEALRVRASKNPKVGHKGRHGVLRTRDRVEPKRGGRPRLLNEHELRQAYVVYKTAGLSIGELARRFAATRETGTYSGYYQSILYGWRKLGLQLRPKGEQIGISRYGTDGTKSKPKKKPCRSRNANGTRCRQFARKDSEHCRSHHDLARVETLAEAA